MSFGIAIYNCRNCKHTFTQQPGPVGDNKNPGCQKCGYMYLDWINFAQWYSAFEQHLKQTHSLIAERITYGI
jgi:hypothetical protein